MPVDTQDVNRHVNKISQIAIVIAVIAVILVVALYLVMRNQQKNLTNTNANTNTVTNTANSNTNTTVSQSQEKTLDAKYEQTVSGLIKKYMDGTQSAQDTGLELEKVSVPSNYKSVHAQLSATLFGSLSDDAKKEKLTSLDQQYSWLIQ